MKLELELFPYGQNGSTKKTLANWGVSDQMDGAFREQIADELNLTFPGAALADSPFTYRSRAIITIDGAPFFAGYVMDNPRQGAGNANSASVQLAGPWWYLENITFQQERDVLTSFDAQNNPVYTKNFLTQYTLNLPVIPNYVGPNGGPNGGGYGSLTYTVTLLDSRAQIVAVLDYAIAKGAWLQYDPADILSVPVLPADVLNITCAEAIRRQLEDVDAVAWFDHSQNPPKFHCQRRAALPNYTRQLSDGDIQDVQGFNLKQRFDLAVPYVLIYFQQPYNVGGINGIGQGFDLYPNPKPGDELKALITTVPLRAVSGTVHTKYIKTDTVAPEDLNWWLRRKPELDVNANPKAPIEYDGLALVPNTSVRKLNAGTAGLTNMIVDGGYCDFMGGAIGDEHIFVQASYHRRFDTNRKGTRVSAHTFRTHAKTTSLSFPNGFDFSFTDFTSLGETMQQFVGMAQTIYQDLNAPQWEGSIPILETEFSGEIVLGKNINLLNGLEQWTYMNALQREIGFKVKPGGIFYSVSVGPNKKLSAQQIADRLRAARNRYITAFNFTTGGATANIHLTRHHAFEGQGNAEPAVAEYNLTEPVAGGDPAIAPAGNVNLTAGAGQPALKIRLIDANGNKVANVSDLVMNIRAAAKLNSLVDGSVQGGTVDADNVLVGGFVDSQGNFHTVEGWQLTTCEDDGTNTGNLQNFTRIFLCTERFKIPGQ
ncbi:MAG: hypothetical protein P4N60_13700 [Verrucomicrobiae bacterium]|nr:hypothetical protein [Verrucomicrobiae bacterium]